MKLAVLIRLLLPALAAALALSCDKEPSVTDEQAWTRPVLVEQARKGPFRVERRFTGQVRSLREVTVAVQEAGTVSEVLLPRDGAPVQQGQTLLRLKSPELDLELQAAKAYCDQTRKKLERYEKLGASGLVALADLDEVRNEADRARFQLEGIELRRARLEVKAPAAGIAASVSALSAGQRCESGQAVLKVVDPSECVVEVVVPESWGEKENQVQEAVVELAVGREAKATPLSLSAEADAGRGGRILKLQPERAAGLVPGAMVAVRLASLLREDVVTVPLEAVVKAEEGETVYGGPAPGEKGKLQAFRVVRGPDDGRRVVIESGVKDGTWVVLATPGQSYYLNWSYLGVGK